MGDVAAAARVSLTTVYRLFPGKRDLFKSVVELHRRTMLALPGDYDDCTLEEALYRIFQIDIDPESEKERDALMTLFIVEGQRFPELHPLLREYGAEQSAILLSAWLQRRAELGLACIPDPSIAAKMLMDIIFGAVSLKSGKGAEWPGGSERKTYLRHCLCLVANGLLPRKEPPGRES